MRIMKKITILVIGCLLNTVLYAVPAYPGWQTKELTDGSTIELRQVGDEFYHHWETSSGKIAVEQPDGRFIVTEEDRPNALQIRAMRQASVLHRRDMRKAIGERNFAPRGLVILVEFKDVQFQTGNDKAAFNDMLNKKGYDYDGATGSAVDYFKAQSNGQYAPTFDVFGPIKLPHNEIYYGEQGAKKDDNDLYIADFVIDAVLAADEAGCDFSRYDSDNNGEVDIVYLFYAGKGQADGGESWTIWPHNWELIAALYYGLIHDNSTYYAYDEGNILRYNLPELDGKIIDSYVCSGELNGSGNRSGIGTLCHEFSHVLGLPDYYDTDYGDNYANGVTPNNWSLMDGGSYNNGGKTPPNYSIYDKYFMGWAMPELLGKDSVTNVVLTTGYADAYQITGGKELQNYTDTNTIYYIENRQQEGWDAYLPGHGMLVWQVQYDEETWTMNAPNNTAGEPRCTVVSASEGKIGLSGCDYNTFPGSKGVNNYAPFLGCLLSSIKEGDGIIQFRYNGGYDGHNLLNGGTGYTLLPGTPTATNGEDFRIVIIPHDKTYDYDSVVVVLGKDTLEESDYSFNGTSDTLTILGTAIDGKDSVVLTLTAFGTQNRYTFAILQDPEVCTLSAEEGMVVKNGRLELSIIAADGYRLDSAICWEVEMGGNSLEYGTGFIYADGVFTIEEVIGNVEIYIYPAENNPFGIDEIEEQTIERQKMLIDGRLYIRRGKTLFDVIGTRIQ